MAMSKNTGFLTMTQFRDCMGILGLENVQFLSDRIFNIMADPNGNVIQNICQIHLINTKEIKCNNQFQSQVKNSINFKQDDIYAIIVISLKKQITQLKRIHQLKICFQNFEIIIRINFQNFIVYLNTTMNGDEKEKVKMSFRLIDDKNKGYFVKDDLAVMIKQIVNSWAAITQTVLSKLFNKYKSKYFKNRKYFVQCKYTHCIARLQNR